MANPGFIGLHRVGTALAFSDGVGLGDKQDLAYYGRVDFVKRRPIQSAEAWRSAHMDGSLAT